MLRRMPDPSASASPFVLVLGITQDAGYPQAGCAAACCAAAWDDPAAHRVACLGIVDPESGERWLVDATPDLPAQLRALSAAAGAAGPPSGVLLTHGHIGHYTGLMYLGREGMDTSAVPVYAMPRMCAYLSSSGPWEGLVAADNIRLVALADRRPVQLNGRIAITPLQVPHRGEYTETAGYIISGPERAALFIPDIDRWEHWSTPVEALIRRVDRAWLDGTFYADGELPGRDMSQIPHPTVSASMARLAPLSPRERARVRFIHLNHTNPLLDPSSPATTALRAAGFGLAAEGERFAL